MRKVIPFNTDSRSNSVVTGSAVRATADNTAEAFLGIGLEDHFVLLQRLIAGGSVATLLERTYSWASDLKLCEGMTYRPAGAASESLVMALGGRHHHQVSYDLTLEREPVGEITFTRRKRYAETELYSLEQALAPIAQALKTAQTLEAAHSLVRSDALTGLGNRASLDVAVEGEVARASRHGNPLAIMMIDVDRFKEINDEFGHVEGDEALRIVARALRSSTRRSDLLFRFGGDEFVVLLPHTDRAGATEAAMQIRETLKKQRFESGSHDPRVPEVSIGVACFESEDDAITFLQKADTNLYHAKRQGRARVCAAL
ncbi:MAG: GGDEF domain-containing protein [Halieaceae bacterium]|jgi:diguanylate cyclase (GGDEF)-like protein|nr:GGDEF domain-containing protein [Halieaceae bacterium]